MLNVYKINTIHTHAQTHCVVAEDMASAERLFLLKYPMTTINSIELISKYVIVEGLEDK